MASHSPVTPNISFNNTNASCEIAFYGGIGNKSQSWGGGIEYGYMFYKLDVPSNTTITCKLKVTSSVIFFAIEC